MTDILSITAPIFLAIGVGYVAVRFRLFSRDELRVLGRYVLYLGLPAMIFYNIVRQPLAQVFNLKYLLAYGLGSLVLYILTVTLSVMRGRRLTLAAIEGMGTAVSNSGFVGFPVALQVLGGPAAIAFALTMVIENVLIIPTAIALAEFGTGEGRPVRVILARTVHGLVRNPLLLAVAAAIVAMVTGLRPPPAVAKVIELISASSAPVSLFVIGGSLVGVTLAGMRSDLFQIATGKLVLHPALVFAALSVVGLQNPDLRSAAIVFAAAPTMGSFPVIGQRYGFEGLCAAALLVSTLSAFATITGVLWILSHHWIG